ncbi:hypothetical protein MBANPS3_011660 [Mucor bainieri]
MVHIVTVDGANSNTHEECKRAVNNAAESTNDRYRSWAKAIVNANFSVLNNISVSEYWESLLAYQTQQQMVARHQELKFINVSSNEIIAPKQTRRQAAAASRPSATSSQFTELDDIIITGLNVSVGSYIGRLARNTNIEDRKSRYFVSLGRNGIIDLKDTSAGSQLSTMSSVSRDALQQKFPVLIEVVAENDDLFSNVMAITDRKYASYIKKTLDRIKKTNDPNPACITQDIYLHVLKLHHHSPHLFMDNQQSFLLCRQVLGPVIEVVFRGSGILLHWGDTISNQAIKQGCRFKMDLRMMSCVVEDMEEATDVGTTEFAKEQMESKYYKDLLKCVLASKTHLNHILQGRCAEEITNVKISLAIFSGMTMDIYALLLKPSVWFVRLTRCCSNQVPYIFCGLEEQWHQEDDSCITAVQENGGQNP